MPDWDDLRLFLAVARSGSFVGSGRGLGLNQTTLARRIGALEDALGARLFDRSPRGVDLTPAGQSLLAHAERMEEAALAATGVVEGRDAPVSGTVRVATPEAFGTYFLAQRVARLHARYPGIELELVPHSRAVSLSKREADIAISLHRPERGRLNAVRLTDYRLGVFGAKSLLAKTGPVSDLATLRTQPYVTYIEEMIDLAELRNLDQSLFARSTFRSSSVAAQMQAVESGVGFGLLHCFAVNPGAGLDRVLASECEVVRTYWMVMHSDLAKVPRIRAVADFLVSEIKANPRIF